jgi:TetR/AcrR family transcriptional regulator, regulator of cefoperazone and chloramphenicol sensitivity
VLQDPTKARLLEAAGAEFAEKGFEAARVRSICQRAGANLAAINYHFGDKERLYEAALLEAHECSKAQVDSSVLEAPPEDRLREFVRQFLTNVLDKGRRGTWHEALMLHELIQPTAAADVLVRESIGPRFHLLKATLRELFPEADDRRLHALAFSTVGQCLHYKVARPISVRLIGEEALEALDVEYLTDHITSVVLASARMPAKARAAKG